MALYRRSSADMQLPGSLALSSLLAMLNDKKPGSSITSVVTATTIDLTCNLLSMDPKDYVKIAEQLNDALDVSNMLDFILCLVVNGHLSNTNATLSDANWRARRLMFKVIAKTPVIPTSLIVTGVSMPAEHDYIGGGGFGHVYKGRLGGATVALKILYKINNSVAFCREALMWGSLKHKFVLPFLGIHEIESGATSRFFLVSPYMENGTLAQWRKRANPSIVEIEERIMQVSQGIEYIHSEGAVHGDLRAENILLDHNFHIQIADFGLTRLSAATATRSGALHINFAAPELFRFTGDDDDATARTQKSDVYAFGCLYYEVHYDSIPFACKTDMQIMMLMFQGLRPPRCHEPPLSDKAWELIQRCWVEEPSERPGMKQVAEWMMGQSDALSWATLTMDAPQPSTLPIISPTPRAFAGGLPPGDLPPPEPQPPAPEQPPQVRHGWRPVPRRKKTSETPAPPAGPSAAPTVVETRHQIQSWQTWQPPTPPSLASTLPIISPTPHVFAGGLPPGDPPPPEPQPPAPEQPPQVRFGWRPVPRRKKTNEAPAPSAGPSSAPTVVEPRLSWITWLQPPYQASSREIWKPDPQLAPTPPLVEPTRQVPSWETWKPDLQLAPTPPSDRDSPGLFRIPSPDDYGL